MRGSNKIVNMNEGEDVEAVYTYILPPFSLNSSEKKVESSQKWRRVCLDGIQT